MKNDIAKRMIAGLVAGAVCGLFGGGGGAVVVAVMTLILGYGQKTAHATACAVMLPITAVSVLTYLTKSEVDFLSAVVIAAGVTGGGFIGAALLPKIGEKPLAVLFAAVTFAVGVKLMLL